MNLKFYPFHNTKSMSIPMKKWKEKIIFVQPKNFIPLNLCPQPTLEPIAMQTSAIPRETKINGCKIVEYKTLCLDLAFWTRLCSCEKYAYYGWQHGGNASKICPTFL